MQPTLVLTAPIDALLYINGRFAGELSQQYPLLRPVSSHGALYLDYRPLSNRCQSMARKLVFSDGAPLPASVEEAEDLNILLWPGGTVEIEFLPELRHDPSYFETDEHRFLLEGNQLSHNGLKLANLPDGAELTEWKVLEAGCALLGKTPNGQFLLALDRDLTRQIGFLSARQLELEADGRVRAIVARDDLVGHATLESWKLTSDGLNMLGSESAWLNGQPAWPLTPEKTARAMVEAALAHLDGEAEIYLTPALRNRGVPELLRQRCQLCLDMKYAPPDPRPCVALLRLISERYGRVEPLYYHAMPAGGPQGAWQIDAIEWDEGQT